MNSPTDTSADRHREILEHRMAVTSRFLASLREGQARHPILAGRVPSHEKVQFARAAIAAGIYDADGTIEAAANRVHDYLSQQAEIDASFDQRIAYDETEPSIQYAE